MLMEAERALHRQLRSSFQLAARVAGLQSPDPHISRGPLCPRRDISRRAEHAPFYHAHEHSWRQGKLRLTVP